MIDTSFNGKEAKKSADYRENLLTAGGWLI